MLLGNIYLEIEHVQYQKKRNEIPYDIPELPRCEISEEYDENEKTLKSVCTRSKLIVEVNTSNK